MIKHGGQGKSLLPEGNSIWKPKERIVHLKCKKTAQRARGMDGIKMRLAD